MRIRSLLAGTALGLALSLASGAHAELSDGMVKIGVLTDFSGTYAAITGNGAVEAAKMAVEDFNARGKGLRVELVSADHQNKPDIALGIARQWFDAEQVDVIVELTTSSIALGAQNLAQEKNRMVLISGAGTSDLTGKACSKHGIHWTYDTYALANSTGRAVVEQGGDRWFMLTVDYAFGHSLSKDVGNAVRKMGGQVIGEVKHPLNTADFSSYLLQAQASKAKIIGLANAGGDLINSIKQAREFGIAAGGQRLAALLTYISDVHALGLDVAQGTFLTTGFYWDLDEETRAWSKRFFERIKMMPTMAQAGVYSSLMHYLEAVLEAGSDDALVVRAKMEERPVQDFFARNGRVRPDGRMVHDMYLAQVKAPDESKGDWDYYKIVHTIPGEQAFRPMSEGGCPLVKSDQ
jgi:branched-chain amino acid transport system substrate-binding protein